MKVSIEVGHGGSDSGAIAFDKKTYEKYISLAVALEVNKILTAHNVDVLMSRTSDTDANAVDFLPKVLAFKPDFGISIHFNAFDGTARGFECYWRNNSHYYKSLILCHDIADEVNKIYPVKHGIPNVKVGQYLMQSINAPSAYLEGCFIDNEEDFNFIQNNIPDLAYAYCEGISEYITKLQL
jgi:N-acetylmuramoyl-L-alanine amidase